MINVKKDSHNFYVGVSKPRLSVLGCLYQHNLNEISDCAVFIFFPNSALRNRGCGLSMDASYTRTFTVIDSQHLQLGVGKTCNFYSHLNVHY